MREFAERFIAMFSFLGVLFLLLFTSIWAPSFERWTGQEIEVKHECVRL